MLFAIYTTSRYISYKYTNKKAHCTVDVKSIDKYRAKINYFYNFYNIIIYKEKQFLFYLDHIIMLFTLSLPLDAYT